MAEQFDELLSRANVRVERILSYGQVTPAEQWYDQVEHEWVLVLQGAGRIQYQDGSEVILNVGDSVDIPAHCRHRVSWTAPQQLTIWLAVFYR
ncbi:cupin domain-containing protein [Shewanella dokdonensis]|uniref:Cupin domain-containing protein n=2 Tax=Shewanella dokdonensis TaxID=712036 RepID=A0ABX8DLS1_9GAMM|nr:cupin domain-containing protein [Shewanella dokdonensis]